MSSDHVMNLKLGEFAKIKGGKRMPSGTPLVSYRTDHPYLRIVDFKDGSIDRSNLQYVPNEVFPAISRYVISSKDLYISIVGTIGLVGTVPPDLSGANLTENAAKICEIDSSLINRCGFHAIRTPSPGLSGQSFHAHPDRQSERSDAGVAFLVRGARCRQLLWPAAHRFALEVDPVSVVHQAIEDGVG